MKKRLFCLVFVFAMLLPTILIPANAYSTGMPQGIQLFAGPRSPYGGTSTYEEYRNSDITKLLTASNEFVINCINGPFNYDINGDQIISSSTLNNMNTSYIFSGTNKNTLISNYSSILARYASNASTNCNLKVLADAQVELAERIIDASSSATIWFSFPFISFYPCALEYEEPFTDYANYIKSQMSTSDWNRNVRGFYWATEEIGWSATFTSSSANNFGNPHVMLMDAMSDLVKGSYGKEFLWMPYMETTAGVGLDKNDVRVGYVANRSTIFDYILLQPGYYFNGNDKLECLRRSTACATNNKVYFYSASNSYTNSNVVGGSKVSGAADIGVVMEINDAIVYGDDSHPASFYNDTYYECTLKFNPIKSQVPIIFYAGARDSLMQTTVFNYIKNFLNY